MSPYVQVKSSMKRYRAEKRGPLPKSKDLSSMEQLNPAFHYNLFGKMHGIHHKQAQRLHHQIDNGNMQVYFSYAQCAMCKDMDHIYCDGTFGILPFIVNNERPWVEATNIMVGTESNWGTGHIYLGMSCI